MGVTFTARMGAAAAYVVTCMCEDAIAQAAQHGSYETARAALFSIPYATEHRAGRYRVPLPGCSEPELCPDYPLWVRPIEDVKCPCLDVNQTNARFLLSILGYDELMGVATPEDFLGRVLIGLALAPVDDGVPAYQEGHWIDCGRQPGYAQAQLVTLFDLATWCSQHDRLVEWC